MKEGLTVFRDQLFSADQGSAAVCRIGNIRTLRAIQFVDEQEGWAAGDEGVIWHTIDGGKSWDRQMTGGVRASFSAC